MTNKEMMRSKIAHLEQLLLESGFVHKNLEQQIDKLQSQINKFKITNDQEHLVQNNDLIIDLIKTRLDLGAQRHHQNVPILPEDDITRDNFYEAVEEALDLCVYLTAFMLRLMKEKEKQDIEESESKENSTK